MKGIVKRITSAVIAGAVILAAVVFDAPEKLSAAAEGSHSHEACADSSHENCTHSEVEYEPFPTSLDGFNVDLRNIIIEDDKNYYLTDDLTDDTFKDIQVCIKDATVNFCLNGHTLDVKGIRVSGSGELNVCDCETDGCFTTNYTYGLLETRTGGTLNIYNGKISSGGIAVMCGDPDEDGSSVTNIYGGEISGGVMVNNGDALSIYGGTVKNVADDSRNGIVVNKNATVNINGGTIVGSKSGIIADIGGSIVNINGGSVESINNSALYIQNGVVCNITDGTVKSEKHCAVYTLDNGVANIKGGNLTCTSFPTVWVGNEGIVDISGGSISNNNYSYYVWNNGTMNISGGEFSYATNSIGYIKNNKSFSLQGSPTLTNTGIWLANNNNITISGALTNTDAYPIYVSSALPRTFTSGWDTHITDNNASKYFKSPYDTAKIVYRNNEAVMVYYYNITYDANGGSCSVQCAEADASDKLTSLAVPTREGYSFDGWFTEETGGEQVTTDTVFTDDTTIYAHWTCNNHIWGDTYEKDENQHWKVCTICGTEDEKTDHQWDNGVTTKEPTEDEAGVMTYTCTVCGKIRTEATAPLGHTHDWNGEWSSDDTYHWRDCLNNCGEKKDNAAHTWNSGTLTKQPTADAEGEKTFECTVCGKTKTETIPAADNPNNPGSGKISIDVQPGENVPATKLKTPFDELIEACLTSEEREAVKNGVDIKIILTVDDATETVPDDDKAMAEAAIKELDGYKLGQYLDLNLLKIIGTSQEKITETNAPITVMFEIPEALRGKGRNYSVIRVHNGEAAVLSDQDDDRNIVTIKTDKFSTYALAYSEKTSGTPSAWNSSGGSHTTSAEDSTPSIEDNNSITPTGNNDNPSTGISAQLILPATAAAVLTIAAKRKKK